MNHYEKYDFSDENAQKIALFYKAMGDETRLRILWVLRKTPYCVQDLANLMEMTEPAISYQLKELRMAKLVKSRREGKKVYYSLRDDCVQDLLDLTLVHVVEYC